MEKPTRSEAVDWSPVALVEAALFAAKEPVSYRRLAAAVGLPDATAARSAVAEINLRLDAEGRAFRAEEVAGGVQMLTRKEFATWLRRRPEIPSEQLLSQAMLETLAIIAYRQPIVRAELEAIRGVNCDEILRQLLQRQLIRIAGRDEDLGRPYLYETTRTFLQLFGLSSLDNLPKLQKIRAAEAEIANKLRETAPSSDVSFLQSDH
ncbi:MAG: SMC-Scp complex subunit ScpB [Planctomycetota bacterium]|jgi:segregation and condensation protein B